MSTGAALISWLENLLIARAHALDIGQESIMTLCGIVPCGSANGGGAAGLNAYVANTFLVGLELAVVGIAIVSLLVISAQLIIFAGDEGTTKESRLGYIYIIVSLAIVALTQWFVQAFAPSETGGALVNTDVVESAIGNVATYIRLLLGIMLMVNVVIQGFRILSSQGEQDQIDKARKRLLGGFLGAALVLLANTIVVAVNPELGGSASLVALEIAGIANYIITILGFLALLGVIIAGVLLMLSADESLKDKAKIIIKTCLIALIIVVLSYAFIVAFILYE